MQSATNVHEAGAQASLIPCARTDDLLIVGALSVADSKVFFSQHSEKQRAACHHRQIPHCCLAGTVIEVRKHVIADYQVGWLVRFVIGYRALRPAIAFAQVVAVLDAGSLGSRVDPGQRAQNVADPATDIDKAMHLYFQVGEICGDELGLALSSVRRHGPSTGVSIEFVVISLVELRPHGNFTGAIPVASVTPVEFGDGAQCGHPAEHCGGSVRGCSAVSSSLRESGMRSDGYH